ncbi:MAG TPA: DUF1345 domain-containing protein [Coleofasciculaceae cyanobacterium]
MPCFSEHHPNATFLSPFNLGDFLDEEHPDYLDFMYFAFTSSMASQTSDVAVTTRPMQRLVLLHAIVPFFFYRVIFSTTVNAIATLV